MLRTSGWISEFHCPARRPAESDTIIEITEFAVSVRSLILFTLMYACN